MSHPSDSPPGISNHPADRLRALFEGRPVWMNAVMGFCFFMALLYMPWDLFIKPVAVDQEVWFGVMVTGWAAKFAGIPHWLIYASGAYGFYKMSGWMWPWAALYSAQVAIGMAVWPLLQFDGMAAIGMAAFSFVPFAWLTWALWNSRERFQSGVVSATPGSASADGR